jgi:outer membrane protein TolC
MGPRPKSTFSFEEFLSMHQTHQRTVWALLLALAACAAPAAAQIAPDRGRAAGPVRRLSVDEAVALALEQNLGIQIDRLSPQIQDLSVAQAKSAWVPNFSTGLKSVSQNQPPRTALSGGANTIKDVQFATDLTVSQVLKTGTSYSLGWNGARTTSTNLFNNFDPLLSSYMSFSVTQPLLRNLKIDNTRQAVETSVKEREAADVQLRSTILSTTRNVKNAYWDLAYQIDNLKAQQQSLDLAKRLLADNEKRVQIGTMAPIDIVEAQSEVARNEEAVIVAEAAIKQAEDRLRALIFNPSTPDFWTVSIEPTDGMPFAPQAVDVEGAVQRALANRTDVQTSKNTLERHDISIRYFRNQILPDVNAELSYRNDAIGGRLLNPISFAQIGAPRTVVDERGFGSVLGDVVANTFPTWTFGVTVAVVAGGDPAEEPGAANRHAGARRRPSGADQSEARRQRACGAGTGRAAARSRGEEVRGRHPDQLLRLPGAARPRSGPHERNPRDGRLQQVARRLRGGAADRAAIGTGRGRGQNRLDHSFGQRSTTTFFSM